ncbi:unnamed protein product, partial [Polarella glacialis]
SALLRNQAFPLRRLAPSTRRFRAVGSLSTSTRAADQELVFAVRNELLHASQPGMLVSELGSRPSVQEALRMTGRARLLKALRMRPEFHILGGEQEVGGGEVWIALASSSSSASDSFLDIPGLASSNNTTTHNVRTNSTTAVLSCHMSKDGACQTDSHLSPPPPPPPPTSARPSLSSARPPPPLRPPPPFSTSATCLTTKTTSTQNTPSPVPQAAPDSSSLSLPLAQQEEQRETCPEDVRANSFKSASSFSSSYIPPPTHRRDQVSVAATATTTEHLRCSNLIEEPFSSYISHGATDVLASITPVDTAPHGNTTNSSMAPALASSACSNNSNNNNDKALHLPCSNNNHAVAAFPPNSNHHPTTAISAVSPSTLQLQSAHVVEDDGSDHVLVADAISQDQAGAPGQLCLERLRQLFLTVLPQRLSQAPEGASLLQELLLPQSAPLLPPPPPRTLSLLEPPAWLEAVSNGIQALDAALKPGEAQVDAQRRVFEGLKELSEALGGELRCYGSTVTGLQTKASDLDVTWLRPFAGEDPDAEALRRWAIQELRRLLQAISAGGETVKLCNAEATAYKELKA